MNEKSSRSVEDKYFPNFEMLDARIDSAFNEIIQNSFFRKKVSLEEQKAPKVDRFLRGRQIAFMIYDYFRVTGAHDTYLDYHAHENQDRQNHIWRINFPLQIQIPGF